MKNMVLDMPLDNKAIAEISDDADFFKTNNDVTISIPDWGVTARIFNDEVTTHILDNSDERAVERSQMIDSFAQFGTHYLALVMNEVARGWEWKRILDRGDDLAHHIGAKSCLAYLNKKTNAYVVYLDGHIFIITQDGIPLSWEDADGKCRIDTKDCPKYETWIDPVVTIFPCDSPGDGYVIPNAPILTRDEMRLLHTITYDVAHIIMYNLKFQYSFPNLLPKYTDLTFDTSLDWRDFDKVPVTYNRATGKSYK